MPLSASECSEHRRILRRRMRGTELEAQHAGGAVRSTFPQPHPCIIRSSLRLDDNATAQLSSIYEIVSQSHLRVAGFLSPFNSLRQHEI